MDMDQSKSKTTNVLFVCNQTGSRLWRVIPVAKYLNQLPDFTCRIIDSAKLTESMFEGYNVVVLQMVFDKRLIKLLKEKGVKIIFEMDDLLTWVPDDHYAKDDTQRWAWKKGISQAIRQADVITTTNEYLKRYYGWLRPFKKNIFVLPNYVDWDFWYKKHNPNKSDTIRIGYIGGTSHNKGDFAIIQEPLKQILKEHDNVKFITVGTGGYSSDNPLTEYNHGKDLFKELPREQYEHQLGTKMEVYADKLNSLALDIGLAPLKDNKFTRSKTPIKWMEYALNRTPCIAQKFLYDQVIDHGINGYVAETENEYYQYLKILVEDKKMRDLIGNRAFWDVQEKYAFEKHAHKWEEIYRQLI